MGKTRWNKLLLFGRKKDSEDITVITNDINDISHINDGMNINNDNMKTVIRTCYKITNTQQHITNYILVSSIWVNCIVEIYGDNYSDSYINKPKFIRYSYETIPTWLNYMTLPETVVIYGTDKHLIHGSNTYLMKCELFLYSRKYYTVSSISILSHLPDNFIYYDSEQETIFLNVNDIDHHIRIYEICEHGSDCDYMYDNIPFKFIKKINYQLATNLYLIKYSYQ